MGVPVVNPSWTPERISTTSASRRAEVCRVRPVARRARSATKSPGDRASPGGQPSTTQPIAGPWLSPKVVTANCLPNVLLATWPPRRVDGRSYRLAPSARVGERPDAVVVRGKVLARGDEDAHLADAELDPGQRQLRQQRHEGALGLPDL